MSPPITHLKLSTAERSVYNASAAVVRRMVPALKLGLVCGLENLPMQGPFLLVPNHCNAWDHYLLGSVVKLALDRKLYFLAKAKFFKSPWSRIWLRSMGAVPLANKPSDSHAYRLIVSLLKNGNVVCIYPEGERNSGVVLLDFAPGAFRMALTAGVRIVPAALLIRHRVDTGHRLGLLPDRVDIAFGEPLDSLGLVPHRAASKGLEMQARTVIARLLLELSDCSRLRTRAEASLSYLNRQSLTIQPFVETVSQRAARHRSSMRRHLERQMDQVFNTAARPKPL